MDPIIIPYRSLIKHIYHISDIHIHLYKRHNEYKEVFTLLFNELKSCKEKLKLAEDKNKNLPIITVITGDILHCKSDLSPECVDLTYQFIKELASIMPVIIIPGNHDINMNNKERMDSLTPIIADLPDIYPIYYLSNTGIWIFNNLVIAHSSIYDYKIIKRSDLDTILAANEHKFTKTAEKNLRFINLFHGRINGVELFNGITLTGEIDKTTNKTITMSAFDGYDLSLFGDVHRHHFLTDTQAYAGSLIQQNYGETNRNHGMIKWDLMKCKGEFIELENKYGYYTFNVNEGIINDLSILSLNIDEFIKNEKLPENLRLRLYYYKTEKSELQDFINKLKDKRNILELTYQEDASSHKTLLNNDLSNTINNDKKLNIYDIEYQNTLLRDILINDEGLDDDEAINAILQINKEYNKLLDINNINQSIGQKFKLLSLSFNNLFSYSNNNFIDFTNMKGIVGIIAPNHTGKSSILDILLFMLYDKFSRKGSIKDMINNRMNDFTAKLEVLMNGFIYTIVKSGELTTKGSLTKSECQFSKKHMISGRIERLEKDNAKKTKEYIKELFGDYEDAINTTFSIQTDATGFIDSENTKRRAELERILRMDFLNVIYKKALGQYKDNKAIFEHLQKTMSSDTIITIQDKITAYQDKLIIECKKQGKIIDQCKKLQTQINELNKEYDTNVEKRMNEFMNNLDSEEVNDEVINKKFQEIEKEINNTETLITENKSKLTKYLKKCDINNINELDNLRNKIKTEKLKLNKKSNDYYIKIEKINGELILDNDNRSIDELNNILKEYNTIEELEKDINECNKKIKKYSDKLIEKEHELQRLMLPTELEHYITDYDKQLNEFNSMLLDYKSNNSVENIDNIIEKIKEFGFIEGLYKHSNNSEANKLITEKIQDYKKRINTNKDKINELTDKLKYIQDINNLINIKINNKTLETELEVLEIQNNTINIELEEVDKKFEYINKVEKYDLLINKYSIEIKELKVKQNSINSVIAELDNLIKRVENNKHIQLQIKEFVEILSIEKDKHLQITKEIDNIRDNISKLQGQLERMRTDAIEKREKETLMNQYKKYADAMKKMPFKLLKNIQLSLEQRINDLLSVITNFTLNISITDKSIDIYLNRSSYDKKKIIINNCSGFERFISSLAIRMALLDITQLPSGNFMAIDEGWACFDKENIANMDIILNYLCQKFDFILTISHLQEIKQHCDIQLNLKRNDNGYSQINYS
jgi:DNA repair exonuclease SbcCD ATPase subunit/predicted MPP superfamily phosphohydrolase